MLSEPRSSVQEQIAAGRALHLIPTAEGVRIPQSFLYLKHGDNGVHREFEVDAKGNHLVRDVVKDGDHFAPKMVAPPTVRIEQDMGDYVAVTDVCADCGSGVTPDPLTTGKRGVCGTCGRERR